MGASSESTRVLLLAAFAASTHCFTPSSLLNSPTGSIRHSFIAQKLHHPLASQTLALQDVFRATAWRMDKSFALPCTLHRQGVTEMSAVGEAGESSIEITPNKLDRALSRLTSAFPLFVLSSAILALVRPVTLQWVNRGDLISFMLASVMCGTGLTLEKKDFTDVMSKNWASVPLGVLCQFCIMPATAWAVGKTMLLPAGGEVGSALFLGLCLVGCSPGGTASNLVSLIAKADVALSVILTTFSTMLAVVATPLLVKLLVGSEIAVSGVALVEATARVVLLPVVLGMLLNARAPKLSQALSRFTPFASVLLVSVICGGVVAQNAPMLLQSSSTVGLPAIVGSVLLLHTLGFAAGYFIPKFGFGRSETSSRTISIEVGMQNSALAVVLARSIGAPPLACLPGALSATVHSCLGSLLAAYWRLGRSNETNDASSNFQI